MNNQAKSRFEVIFEVEGTNTGKFRNDMQVHMRGKTPATVSLATDEGPLHGGDGTAPYPLAYFSAGLAACVMTQLRAFAMRLSIPAGALAVNVRCHWQAEQTGSQPYESAPVAFTVDIDLGDDVSEPDKRRLIAAAEKGCFIEQSLKPGIVRHRMKAGGVWVEL